MSVSSRGSPLDVSHYFSSETSPETYQRLGALPATFWRVIPLRYHIVSFHRRSRRLELAGAVNNSGGRLV